MKRLLIIFLLVPRPMLAAATEHFKFGVATFNILAQTYYEQHYAASGVRGNHAGIMPANERQEKMKSFFHDLLKDHRSNRVNSFIFALQENDGSLQELLSPFTADQDIHFYQTKPIGLAFLVIGHWNIIQPPVHYTFRTPGADSSDKGYYILKLQPLAHNNTPLDATLGIINVHLKGGPGPNGPKGYTQFRRDQVQEIAHYIAQNKNSINYWIVCGDFNTDLLTNLEAYAAIRTELQASSRIDFFDVYTLQGMENRATSYKYNLNTRTHLENMDYIFYSTGLTTFYSRTRGPQLEKPPILKNHILKALLTHGQGTGDPRHPANNDHIDAKRNFFSDHMPLGAEFSLLDLSLVSPPASARRISGQHRRALPSPSAQTQRSTPQPTAGATVSTHVSRRSPAQHTPPDPVVPSTSAPLVTLPQQPPLEAAAPAQTSRRDLAQHPQADPVSAPFVALRPQQAPVLGLEQGNTQPKKIGKKNKKSGLKKKRVLKKSKKISTKKKKLKAAVRKKTKKKTTVKKKKQR